MTSEDGGHPTPGPEAEVLAPRLKAGVGEQPPFATERLGPSVAERAEFWKRRLVRVLALALALLILWGLWRWFGRAGDLREPCVEVPFPAGGCEQPPGVWRSGQFVLMLIGIPVGLTTAVLSGYAAVAGRRIRGLAPAALTYLGVLLLWIAMYWIGRLAW